MVVLYHVAFKYVLTVAQSEFGFGGGGGELLIVGDVVDDYLKALVKQISLLTGMKS